MDREGDGGQRRRNSLLVAVTFALLGLALVGAAAPRTFQAVLPTPAASVIGLPAIAADGDARVPRGARSPGFSLVAESLTPRGIAAPKTVSLEASITSTRGERTLGQPTLHPNDPGWVARRLEIPALGVNVAVAMAGSSADEAFPPYGGAYILRSTAQPGRGTNSYLFAHAVPQLFLPIWNARPGQQVIVTMSDGQELSYRVTGVVRNIPCPDPSAYKPAGLPAVLANATGCDLSWTQPTSSERLTMQTSQGPNRNYGEMVVLAEPDWER